MRDCRVPMLGEMHSIKKNILTSTGKDFLNYLATMILETSVSSDRRDPLQKMLGTRAISRETLCIWKCPKIPSVYIPFKKHWSHSYLSPNKAYEYAHAGLYVMCTSSLTSILETLKGNCSTFEGYETLVPD